MLPVTIIDPVICWDPEIWLDPVVKYLPSIVVSLVLIEPLAVLYDPLTTAKDALAVVNTEAVDSSLVILALSEPEFNAKLADAASSVVVLVENDAEAVVNTLAVDSKLVVLVERELDAEL